MTTDELFEAAIAWELEAKALYLRLAQAFPEYPLVEKVWRHMAADEALHASMLTDVRESLAAEQLAEPLTNSAIDSVAAVAETLAEARAAELRTLDDAYELAHALESSEVNGVFQLLVLDRLDDSAKAAVLKTQLHEHVERLEVIRRNLDRPLRQKIPLRES